MLTRTRRRSARITLVLMGAAAALAACGSDSDQKRDLYASKQDCVRDWGDETKCEQAPASVGSSTGRTHSGAGYFWGPMYSGSGYRFHSSGASSSIGSTRAGSHAIGSSSVSRGGFGHSASAHSSGG